MISYNEQVDELKVFEQGIKVPIYFKHGECVYLRTDVDQLRRIVVGYMIRTNHIMYELAHNVDVSYHSESEISRDKVIF